MNIIKLLYILFNKKKIELKTMLTVNEIEVFRKVVKNFTVKNPNIKKSEIVKHFMKEGFARKKYHQDSPYIFWPDLASSHYAGVCTKWMTGKINFVEKGINPPNIPQARPIENFWGDLSQKVYEKDWQAKTKDQLINRIKSKLKEFDLKDLQSHMRRVTAKLRNIADHGVFGPFKN